ncbi:MAG: acetylornithine deacetylase, partial [Chloroflexota bacterium]
VLEREPRIYGDTPWMDAALLQAAGIPTAVFGPGGAGAHAIEEYSCIPEVAACAEILVRTAEGFCGLAG